MIFVGTVRENISMKILTHDTHTFHALTAGASMDNNLGLSCQIHKELSLKRYIKCHGPTC